MRRPAARSASADRTTTGPRPISHWSTGGKLIALTYDDGPNPAITPKLLELLRAKGARATFFVLGDSIRVHPELVRAIVDAGMEVGNHSDTHPQFTKLPESRIRAELATNHQRIVAAAPGAQVRTMRPPYGAWNPTVMRVAQDMGYKVILWNVDTEDWRKHTTEQITQEILSHAHDGAIVLMHDRYHQTSLAATGAVIDALSAQGYRFVTVSELLEQPVH
jgi:peptidoglycan/xylan/chitin deacetylase (PgdA/CDA1 family)